MWCSEVLEHVADTAHALLEARRVLRPGGRLLVTVPFHGRVKGAAIALARFERTYDPLGQHVRFYTRRSLAGALAAAGCDDVRVARGGRRAAAAGASSSPRAPRLTASRARAALTAAWTARLAAIMSDALTAERGSR